MPRLSDLDHPVPGRPAGRRAVLRLFALGGGALLLGACGSGRAEGRQWKVRHSEAEWRRRLTKAQYRVLREAGTERAFSSPLDRETRAGTFLCAGCGNALYSSRAKYDSGTGWPSFRQPLPGAIATATDFKLGYPRTEVLCADCGGHLGHVFGDGPRPTGKRYCMNGTAMRFRPA
jgi:peptide-methionine (R)-S-oxide reductase